MKPANAIVDCIRHLRSCLNSTCVPWSDGQWEAAQEALETALLTLNEGPRSIPAPSDTSAALYWLQPKASEFECVRDGVLVSPRELRLLSCRDADMAPQWEGQMWKSERDGNWRLSWGKVGPDGKLTTESCPLYWYVSVPALKIT